MVQDNTHPSTEVETVQDNGPDAIVEEPVEPGTVPVPSTAPAKVMFVGKQTISGKDVPQKDAPTWLRSGYTIFDDLPDTATQKAGWDYKRGSELCRAFPALYKRITVKGE